MEFNVGGTGSHCSPFFRNGTGTGGHGSSRNAQGESFPGFELLIAHCVANDLQEVDSTGDNEKNDGYKKRTSQKK